MAMPPARTIVSGAACLALAALARRDLQGRPAADINGDKRLWAALVFATVGIGRVLLPVGAVAYALFGLQALAPERRPAGGVAARAWLRS